MKNKNRLKLYLLLLIVIAVLASSFVSAQYRPGNVVTEIGRMAQMVMSLLMNEWIVYLFTFIFYFVMYYGLFETLARKVKVFGGEGKLPKSAKTFIVGLTGLCAVATFALEKTGNVKTILLRTLGPFSMWAGAVLTLGLFSMVYFGYAKNDKSKAWKSGLIVTGLGLMWFGYQINADTLYGFGMLLAIAGGIGALIGVFTQGRDSKKPGETPGEKTDGAKPGETDAEKKLREEKEALEKKLDDKNKKTVKVKLCLVDEVREDPIKANVNIVIVKRNRFNRLIDLSNRFRYINTPNFITTDVDGSAELDLEPGWYSIGVDASMIELRGMKHGTFPKTFTDLSQIPYPDGSPGSPGMGYKGNISPSQIYVSENDTNKVFKIKLFRTTSPPTRQQPGLNNIQQGLAVQPNYNPAGNIQTIRLNLP